MHRGAAHESAVKLSPEDPPSLRGYLGYLAMESDRNIRFRYLGDLPAKLGSVRFNNEKPYDVQPTPGPGQGSRRKAHNSCLSETTVSAPFSSPGPMVS